MKTLRERIVRDVEELPDAACDMKYAVVCVPNIENAPTSVYAMFRTERDAEKYVEPIREAYKSSPGRFPFEIREIVK